jgi:hypothetical protein
MVIVSILLNLCTIIFCIIFNLTRIRDLNIRISKLEEGPKERLSITECMTPQQAAPRESITITNVVLPVVVEDVIYFTIPVRKSCRLHLSEVQPNVNTIVISEQGTYVELPKPIYTVKLINIPKEHWVTVQKRLMEIVLEHNKKVDEDHMRYMGPQNSSYQGLVEQKKEDQAVPELHD